jgi:hypothetical protein
VSPSVGQYDVGAGMSAETERPQRMSVAEPVAVRDLLFCPRGRGSPAALRWDCPETSTSAPGGRGSSPHALCGAMSPRRLEGAQHHKQQAVGDQIPEQRKCPPFDRVPTGSDEVEGTLVSHGVAPQGLDEGQQACQGLGGLTWTSVSIVGAAATEDGPGLDDSPAPTTAPLGRRLDAGSLAIAQCSVTCDRALRLGLSPVRFAARVGGGDLGVDEQPSHDHLVRRLQPAEIDLSRGAGGLNRVALPRVAAERRQDLDEFGTLDPLGNDAKSESMAEVDD